MTSQTVAVLNSAVSEVRRGIDSKGVCYGWRDYEDTVTGERPQDRIVNVNGHWLEWLSEYLGPEDLAKDPFPSAYARLAEEIALACQTEEFVDYGALCHGMHALRLYSEKCFAPVSSVLP